MSGGLQSTRAAGVLMSVTSLPSPYGIGTFGKAARDWVDFLQAAGQRYWQVLPLNPTGFADSPYQSFSAFAGNPYLIDLDVLVAEGLLTEAECAGVIWGEDASLVDYGALNVHREPLLRKAFARFADQQQVERFHSDQAFWIDDYALFMAVKESMGKRSWTLWPEDIRLRRPEAMARYRHALAEDISFHIFVQYLFFSQWQALRSYANARGIHIIGDIPIYVAMDSADSWGRSGLFELDADRKPVEVAGCPPDAFSRTGQLWGNPLYRWDVMAEDGFAWWMERLRACFALYDVVRIDHFRGIEGYYAIPAGDETAEHGRWRKGPGDALLARVREVFPQGEIIAEDLGYLNDEVRAMLRRSGYPGMKVLQFAFDSREESDYLPHNYTRECVVYTGTHDNDTVAGWFETAGAEDVALAMDYLGIDGKEEGVWAFVRAALSSVAALAVVPMQDYLGLGSEARMNVPSTIGGRNWRWRMRPGMDMDALAKRICHMTKLYGR